MTTINKPSHDKPDVVRIDDEWEQWCMEYLIENRGKWLKGNKPEELMESPTDTTTKEKHWFSKGEGRASVSKPSKILSYKWDKVNDVKDSIDFARLYSPDIL